jgi:predicted DsbA family dithiol-disulfide isomerase
MDTRHLFYGDFNCPFCYALNEQLHELGLQQAVHFHGVQHLITAEQWATDSPKELEEEVRRVKARFRSLEIHVPRARVNTAPVMHVVAEAQRTNPEQESTLRLALYRALWVRGEDISSATVLDGVCKAVGLKKRVTPASRRLAESWQTQWESGDFERRIPVLLAPGGARSMGLDASRRTAAFLRAGLLSSDSGETCG